MCLVSQPLPLPQPFLRKKSTSLEIIPKIKTKIAEKNELKSSVKLLYVLFPERGCTIYERGSLN